jgi:CBS domain-containing protein
MSFQQRTMLPLSDVLTPSMELLTKFKVEEAMNRWQTKRIAWLDDSRTLGEALKVLAAEKVLSLPVRDRQSDEWTGFVDYVDILAFALKTITGETDDDKMQWATYPTDAAVLNEKGKVFGTARLKDLIEQSNKDWKTVVPFYPVNRAATMFQVVESLFCKGVHRVPVIEDSGRLVGIISQSDIGAALAANLDELGALAFCPLSILKLGDAPPITMSDKAPAIAAFFLMIYNKISAVAIVDQDNKLVANLSAHDLKILSEENLGVLLEPIMQYLARFGGARKPVSCGKHSLFGTVLRTMTMNHVHRIWVVDEEERVTGVVSLSDVCALLASTRPPTGPDVRQRWRFKGEVPAENKGQGIEEGLQSLALKPAENPQSFKIE